MLNLFLRAFYDQHRGKTLDSFFNWTHIIAWFIFHILYQEGRQRKELLKPLREMGIEIKMNKTGPSALRKDADKLVVTYLEDNASEEGKTLLCPSHSRPYGH